MTRDLGKELAETPDEPTTLWSPSVGDILVGTLKVLDTVQSKFGGTQPRLVVQTDGGEMITVYARHTVLQQELAKAAPVVGDRIAIRRLQDVPGKNYRRYKVLVDHRTAQTPATSATSPITETPLEPVDDVQFVFGKTTGERLQ